MQIGSTDPIGARVRHCICARGRIAGAVQVTGLEYEISQMESRLRDLQQDTSNLRLEAASLSSPERIERVARKELNLRLPSPEQVITVD